MRSMTLRIYSTGVRCMTENNKNTGKCSLCGLCKANCPVYKTTLKEKNSPRGKAIMLKEEELSAIFYNCTLCGACIKECPIDIDLELKKARAELVKKGIKTKANEKMIQNVRKYGNPFGKPIKGEGIKNLYCC